ncbi:MAG: hypothetical protein ABFD79_16925 [Phycisphaerales bacterium]
MDNALFFQLYELVQACHKADVKTIICGGLGVYLSFSKRQNDICNMIRATQDIDLMFSKSDLVEEAKRKAIAEIITNELEYVVCNDKQHHGFMKGQNRRLDILAPPVEGLTRKNYRVCIVKSKVHGHYTEEARFIDEGLRTLLLSDIMGDSEENKRIKFYVPSPTNMMIMKLYAFADRI